MSGKWWRYALIGVLLLDLCLFVVRTGSMFDQGKNTAPWALGLTLQNVSSDPCSARTQTTENLTAATVFLLTAMTLM